MRHGTQKLSSEAAIETAELRLAAVERRTAANSRSVQQTSETPEVESQEEVKCAEKPPEIPASRPAAKPAANGTATPIATAENIRAQSASELAETPVNKQVKCVSNSASKPDKRKVDATKKLLLDAIQNRGTNDNATIRIVPDDVKL
jgi:hypothetical protein